MQYWVIYTGGVGGDGFVNLLEHAHGFHSPDSDSKYWRIDTVHNNKLKFVHPFWTLPYTACPPFRNHPNIETGLTLNKQYVHRVTQGDNIAIPAHYVYFEDINNSRFKEIVETDQILIHLYSTNYERVVSEYRTKLQTDEYGCETDTESIIRSLQITIDKQLNNPAYDYHIDIDKFWHDEEYMQERLAAMSIEIDQKYIDIYKYLIRI